MKILQLITELTPAGAERVVCELAKGLKNEGDDVLVLSLMPLPKNESILEELRSSQIEVQSLSLTKGTAWRIAGIRRILKEFKPDIVHSHLIHPNIIARLAKLAFSTKFRLINTVHIAERRPGKWWHFFLDRITFGLCDLQTCVSKAVRDFHSAKIAKPPDVMPVIYNGLPDIPKPGKSEICELRRGWGLEKCSKVIGSVGRLDWQKGYDILLKQVPRISQIVPEGEKWGLVILGEGQERAGLELIAGEDQVDNIIVKMPGFRKDAARSIGAFDLFVMPSRYEGFGLTLIEAMMHGVPILASSADSLPELMEHYNNGECIDFENGELLTAKCKEFIKTLSVQSRHIFSDKAMIKNYIHLYHSVTLKN